MVQIVEHVCVSRPHNLVVELNCLSHILFDEVGCTTEYLGLKISKLLLYYLAFCFKL